MSLAAFAGFVLLHVTRVLVLELRGVSYALYLGIWREAKLVLGVPLS